MLNVSESITVRKPREEVFAFWRDFENFPLFMKNVKEVHSTGDGRSHWVADGPAGKDYEWDAEIVSEIPGEQIAWRTLGDSDVRHEGSVLFRDASGGPGTEVHVNLKYDPPAGKVGAAVAKLFGDEPSQQIREDLRRFKEVVETEAIAGGARGTGTTPQKRR